MSSLGEAFYYTTENAERMSEQFDERPYVSVVMFDEDDNPTVAFESQPGGFPRDREGCDRSCGAPGRGPRQGRGGACRAREGCTGIEDI